MHTAISTPPFAKMHRFSVCSYYFFHSTRAMIYQRSFGSTTPVCDVIGPYWWIRRCLSKLNILAQGVS